MEKIFVNEEKSCIGFRPKADPIKLFFLRFQIFVVKLGHFTINEYFYK